MDFCYNCSSILSKYGSQYHHVVCDPSISLNITYLCELKATQMNRNNTRYLIQCIHETETKIINYIIDELRKLQIINKNNLVYFMHSHKSYFDYILSLLSVNNKKLFVDNVSSLYA